jgi:hypothetical protein
LPIHWLDANVYIQAKNGPYAFERFPRFWVFLAEQLELGNIKSPKQVYDELTEGDDLLSTWCKRRRSKGLCVTAGRDVQACFRQIANHVHGNYRTEQALVFLGGGDPWVIAQAMATNGIVVTQESNRSKSSKVKMPTVCHAFRLQCIGTYEMLANFDFRYE